MVTYSKADLAKVPDKARFIEIVCKAFTSTGTAKIIQYACAQESHEDGSPHFHLILKLDKQKRWRCVRNYLEIEYGVKVNFTNEFTNYYDGYQYVIKSDEHTMLSDNHPALNNPYRTANATQARRQGHNRMTRKRSFDAVDLADVIEKNKIHDKIELLNLVKKQKKEGKRDLALYVFNNIDKSIKILSNVWEMHSSDQVLERRTTQRMELLGNALKWECVESCAGRWLSLAKETLDKNNISVRTFSGAVSEAIERGRGKDWNILLAGGVNCGKTFILKPLQKIFHTFSNTADGTFAWLGVENAEIIFLNDFRWDKKIISWKDFLLLLEGDELHFSAPKTSYAQDILFDKDTPVFATADECFKRTTTAVKDNYMMTLRWKKFEFTYEIPEKDIVRITPCGPCFADLVINN